MYCYSVSSNTLESMTSRSKSLAMYDTIDIQITSRNVLGNDLTPLHWIITIRNGRNVYPRGRPSLVPLIDAFLGLPRNDNE